MFVVFQEEERVSGNVDQGRDAVSDLHLGGEQEPAD